MIVRRVLRFVPALAVACLAGIDLRAQPAAAGLTIEVGGDLLIHGGVVVVYPLPTSAEAANGAAGESGRGVVRIDKRYAQVQLRYPAGGTFAYRFRPVAGTADANKHSTQVLSIIGTDEEGRGPQMSAGFNEAYSSGGRIIRLPAMAELAGPDEASRTEARWGRSQGYVAVPPADQRSARARRGRRARTDAASPPLPRRPARSGLHDPGGGVDGSDVEMVARYRRAAA